MAKVKGYGSEGYGAHRRTDCEEPVKLVDHPEYRTPQLRTKWSSLIGRLCFLCLILVVVVCGCVYLMVRQLAAGYVAIKPGTTAGGKEAPSGAARSFHRIHRGALSTLPPAAEPSEGSRDKKKKKHGDRRPRTGGPGRGEGSPKRPGD